MTLNLWLMHWLLSARAFLAVGQEEGFEAARERIRGRDFWVVRDPSRPSQNVRKLRQRGAEARVLGYRVLVEVGLEDELPQFVRRVGAVLEDARGWEGAGLDFVPVDRGERFSVLLARPRTVDRLCRPLRTRGQYSCGRKRRATLNLTRWREGAEPWGEELAGYRVYMINHEVGHLLGMPHANCEGPGGPAAVMQQQTMGLEGCEAQAWPLPREVDYLHSRWH